MLFVFRALAKYLAWRQAGTTIFFSMMLLSPYIQAMEKEDTSPSSGVEKNKPELIAAIERLDVDAVKLLSKEWEVDIYVTQGAIGDALLVALNAASPNDVEASSRQFEIISLLLEYGPLHEVNSFGVSYLSEAVSPHYVDPNIEVVKLLINKGFSINCVDGLLGYTPLSHALVRGSDGTTIAELLLSNGASVNLGNKPVLAGKSNLAGDTEPKNEPLTVRARPAEPFKQWDQLLSKLGPKS